MFKKFLERILNATTNEELEKIMADIDKAFCRDEKISGKENELLYRTINQLYSYKQRKLV